MGKGASSSWTADSVGSSTTAIAGAVSIQEQTYQLSSGASKLLPAWSVLASPYSVSGVVHCIVWTSVSVCLYCQMSEVPAGVSACLVQHQALRPGWRKQPVLPPRQP